MQLFSTPVTSSNLRNQAPLFTEICLLQATSLIMWKNYKAVSILPPRCQQQQAWQKWS